MQKAQAVRLANGGGPEVMALEGVDLPAPAENEVLVRHEAIGLNFIDTYQRSGLYPLSFPSGLGLEGAGVIEACGSGIRDYQVGDRVAYCTGPIGAYASARLMPTNTLVKLPKWLDAQRAAAMMLKGLTVQYLIRQTYAVKPRETVLFHAAAGGVGLIACQWLDSLGVTVIGTVGSEEKAKLALAHGCHHVINYRTENVVERVKALTGGKGVPVVYDSVGKDTWDISLECLQPRGLMVTFGNASGPVDPFNPGILGQKGSLYVTRPTLMSYANTPDSIRTMAQDLFKVVKSGDVEIRIDQTYPLAEIQQAHRDLEGRKTTGSTVILP